MLSASSRSRCVSARTWSLDSRFTAAPLSMGCGAVEWSGVFLGLGPWLPGFGLLRRLALDRIDQRLQPVPVLLPALDRRLVNRPPHLRDAGGLHRPVRLVEVDAFVVPRQAEEFDQPLRLFLGVGDD